MKIKVTELAGTALDWAVAKCEFPRPDYCEDDWLVYVKDELEADQGIWTPSTSWSQGGPIIEREQLTVESPGLMGGAWVAGRFGSGDRGPHGYGPTPLVAAMRCYVASQLGDEIEIPEELA